MRQLHTENSVGPNTIRIYFILKGSVSRDFWPPFFALFEPFWAPDKQTKVFSNSFSILLRYSITKFEKFKILGLANQKLFSLNLFFMIEMFTPKRISPDCPFKSSQRPPKFSILTPQCDAHCGAWLRGIILTAELDFMVGYTPWKFAWGRLLLPHEFPQDYSLCLWDSKKCPHH